MRQESLRVATEEDEAYKAGKPPGNQGESKSSALDDDRLRGDSPPPYAAVVGAHQQQLEKDGGRGFSRGTVEAGGSRRVDGEGGGQSGASNAAVVAGHGAVVAAQANAARSRSPSSTLARLLVVQVQFLAVLSLVDSVSSRSWWFSQVLEDMR